MFMKAISIPLEVRIASFLLSLKVEKQTVKKAKLHMCVFSVVMQFTSNLKELIKQNRIPLLLVFYYLISRYSK